VIAGRCSRIGFGRIDARRREESPGSGGHDGG